MASPVTVIPVPGNENMHILFTLNKNKQLALELRSTSSPDEYERYADHGTSQGVVQNPGQLSAVMQNGLVTVYGLAKSGASENQVTAVSTLSPIYNPIANTAASGEMVQTNYKGVAACSDGKSGNWVFHTGLDDKKERALFEVQVKNGAGKVMSLDLSGNPRAHRPGSDSNLAAFWEGHPFVFYTNTDDGSNIFYYNIGHNNLNPISGTSSVKPGSPLAVTKVRSQNNQDGVFHYIILYYVTRNSELGRVVGILRDRDLSWSSATTVEEASLVDEKSMLAVATKDSVNYVYFISSDPSMEAGVYTAYVDANENWRRGQ